MDDTSKLHGRLEDMYTELLEPVNVVYHPDSDASWSRAEFQGSRYDKTTPYNHRTIFRSEVVLEYDDASKRLNYKLAKRASRKLYGDYISHSMWTSGNKSTHIHILFDMSEVDDVRLMKRTILAEYGCTKHRDQYYKPDMALASPNHLVRAEWGVHEKTGDCKRLIDEDIGFPELEYIPEHIQETYEERLNDVQYDRDVQGLAKNVLESDGFQWLLKPSNMKEVGDGRKRAVFILGNVLREATSDDDDDVIEWVQDWYRKAGGHDYSDGQIQQILLNNFQDDKTPGFPYLNELLSDIGKERFINKE